MESGNTGNQKDAEQERGSAERNRKGNMDGKRERKSRKKRSRRRKPEHIRTQNKGRRKARVRMVHEKEMGSIERRSEKKGGGTAQGKVQEKSRSQDGRRNIHPMGNTLYGNKGKSSKEETMK